MKALNNTRSTVDTGADSNSVAEMLDPEKDGKDGPLVW